jgi:hypothetical protein
MAAIPPKKPLGFKPKVKNTTVAPPPPNLLLQFAEGPPPTDTLTALVSPVAPIAPVSTKPKPSAIKKPKQVFKPKAPPAPRRDAIEAKPRLDRLDAQLEELYPEPQQDEDENDDTYLERVDDIQSKRNRITRRTERDPVLQGYRVAQDANETQNHYLLDTSVFMPATRRAFYPFVQETYASIFGLPPRNPDEEIDPLACQKLMDAGKQAVETFLYQRFVKEYIRQASPYRGILVYHGLGSGKTCSSIAAAEALYGVANKRIIVMTPFSLRANFIKEITFCGFKHFSLNNHWVPYECEYKIEEGKKGSRVSKPRFQSHIRLYAESVLSLSEDYINALLKQTNATPTIWIPDFTREPNYLTDALTPVQRDQIRNQINESVNNRIQFINYNGVRAEVLKAWACEAVETGKTIFDDAVIVIDEIHNLIRLMQGAIVPFLKSRPGKRRKLDAEPVTPGTWKPKLCTRSENYNRAFLFYRLLCGAKNTKIIGLSGTPIINFPEELGILSNVLGGYIDSFTVTVSGLSAQNKTKLMAIMNRDPRTDLVYVKGTSGAGTELFVSIFQEGYVKVVNEAGEFKGVQYDEIAQESVQEIYARIKTVVASELPDIRLPAEAVYTAYPRLPPDDETFRGTFINQVSNEILNPILLKKRLTGLISYYKGSKEEFMPKVLEDTVVKCTMSEYMLEKYIEARNAELKKEMTKEKGGPTDLFALVEMFAKAKNPSSYRFRSRAICNFVFPKSIPRPFPDNLDAIDAETKPIDDVDIADRMTAVQDDTATVDELIGLEAQQERDRLDAELAMREDEAALASVEDTGPLATATDATTTALATATGAVESALETVTDAITSMVTPAPLQKGGDNSDSDSDSEQSIGAEAIASAPTAKPIAERALSYEEMIARAISQLRANRNNYLNLDAPVPEKTLAYYSPKLDKILRKIAESPGSALVYSQFKTVEGLGVLGISLEANGYEEIKLAGRADTLTDMRLSPESEASIRKGPGAVNRYITFSGEGTKEQRAVVLAIFNGNFSGLPRNIASVFEAYDASVADKTKTYAALANRHGEICKVIGITGAGAEGISLKCVRQVHILEPYWNMVRLDQVKGRAIRICSHADLPPEERNVSIYTYVTGFSPEQITGAAIAGALQVDRTILMKDQNMTSDESVLDVSTRKQAINENLLKIMKESAVDCLMNSADNESDLECFVTDTRDTSVPMFYPDLDVDRTETAATTRAQATAKPLEPVGGAGAASASLAAPGVKPGKATQIAETITLRIRGEETTFILRQKTTDSVNDYYLLSLNSYQRPRPIALGEAVRAPDTGRLKIKLYPAEMEVEHI